MAVHINWFGVLPEWGLPLTNVQAAAAMCDGLVKYRAALHAGTIPVESMRGNPLDMHQFLRVFGMTRVPQEGADVLHQVDDSRHVALVVVLRLILDALHLFRWSVHVLAARLRHESLEGRMQRGAVAAGHVD